MKKSRLKLVVILVTFLALAAGVTAGMLAAKLPASTAPPLLPPIDRTPLAEELQLNPDQRDQMRTIWEGVRTNVHETFQLAQQVQKERDDALVALLNDDQKAAFEKIARQYADEFTDLTRQRDQTFADAVERTRKLLNAEQRTKYEEILKTHVPPNAGASFEHPRLEPSPLNSPATKPG